MLVGVVGIGVLSLLGEFFSNGGFSWKSDDMAAVAGVVCEDSVSRQLKSSGKVVRESSQPQQVSKLWSGERVVSGWLDVELDVEFDPKYLPEGSKPPVIPFSYWCKLEYDEESYRWDFLELKLNGEKH